MDFDTKLASWGWSGLASISPEQSPTLLIARFCYWVIVMMGALMGIAAFDATMTQQMVLLRLFAYLPNFTGGAPADRGGQRHRALPGAWDSDCTVNLNLPCGRLLSLGRGWVIVLTAAMAMEHLSRSLKPSKLANL